MQLYIGNKNYSSWSMRPWVLMTQAGIPFEEVMLRFDAFTPESNFKTELRRVSPVGKVPVLVDDGLVVADTLAIAEYLAERHVDQHSGLPLWPADPRARALARSACAEMHSGFGALRSHCPMNVEAALPAVGERLLREHEGLRTDLARIVQLWSGLLQAHAGPLLFGTFSIADAYFAPVVMRLTTYALPVPAEIQAYLEQVRALPGVAAWVRAARAENDFLAFEEPYRQRRD